MASCAPACCSFCAIPQAMLRLLATPKTTAILRSRLMAIYAPAPCMGTAKDSSWTAGVSRLSTKDVELPHAGGPPTRRGRGLGIIEKRFGARQLIAHVQRGCPGCFEEMAQELKILNRLFVALLPSLRFFCRQLHQLIFLLVSHLENEFVQRGSADRYREFAVDGCGKKVGFHRRSPGYATRCGFLDELVQQTLVVRHGLSREWIGWILAEFMLR